MKTLYRIESPTTGEGLWYRPDGSYAGVVTTVPLARCRDLPMQHDAALTGGWRSATESLDAMRTWISPTEVPGLAAAGLCLWGLRVHDGGWRLTTEPYAHAVFRDAAVVERHKLLWLVLYPLARS